MTSHQSAQRLRIGMGTFIAIEASGPPAVANVAIEAAYAAMLQVEHAMHPRREGSDLARINGAAAGSRLAISAATGSVLALCKRIHDLTDGVFDPCLPEQAGALSDLELIGHDSLICHRTVGLDLGGIAKGYAVDQAVLALQAHGCDRGIVNAGGDLRIFGAHAHEIWLRSGAADYRSLRMHEGALAVSDLDEARRPDEHRGYYNRRSRQPPRTRYAAVWAPEAASADALTKCVLLATAAEASRALAALGARVLA